MNLSVVVDDVPFWCKWFVHHLSFFQYFNRTLMIACSKYLNISAKYSGVLLNNRKPEMVYIFPIYSNRCVFPIHPIHHKNVCEMLFSFPPFLDELVFYACSFLFLCPNRCLQLLSCKSSSLKYWLCKMYSLWLLSYISVWIRSVVLKPLQNHVCSLDWAAVSCPPV